MRKLVVSLLLPFLTGACGSDDSLSDEAAPATLRVTGTLSDWVMPDATDKAARFEGYQFLLLDAASGEVQRAQVGSSGGFVMENVPAERNYYGVLLDADFRFGRLLQVASGGKESQVFRLPASGTLGSLSIEGSLLRSSQQDTLSPVSGYAFRDTNRNGIPDGLEGAAPLKAAGAGDLDADGTADQLDPDLDDDGVPNSLDPDVDGDGVSNLFDPDSNQNAVADARETPAQAAAVFQDVVPGTAETRRALWIVLSGGSQTFASVKVSSGAFLAKGAYERANGAAFAGRLYDDGTHGDGLAGDNLWSALVQLPEGITFQGDHVLIFTVTRADGTTAESLFRMAAPLASTLGVNVSEWTESATSLDVSWQWTVQDTSEKFSAFEVLLLDATGTRVHSSPRLPATQETPYSIPVSLLSPAKTYACVVRALTPSPIGGFPGSATRSSAASVVRSPSESP